MRKLILGMTAALAVGALSLTSCSDSNVDDSTNVAKRTFNYQQSLADAVEDITIPLDSLESPVQSIINPTDWITATAATTYEGCPQ